MKIDSDSVAAFKIHPGILFFALLVLGESTHRMLPLGMGLEGLKFMQNVGIGLMALGGLAMLLAFIAMVRAGTSIEPTKPSLKVVTNSIYAFSRNPVYVGYFLILVGRGLQKNNILMMLCAALLVTVMYWAVIRAEEAYLEAKFGTEYKMYKQKVRRWL